MYLQGEGVPKDAQSALPYFPEASTAGDAQATRLLGVNAEDSSETYIIQDPRVVGERTGGEAQAWLPRETFNIESNGIGAQSLLGDQRS